MDNNHEYIGKIYKWSILIKYRYYVVDNIKFINSKFHNTKIPVFLINNNWYWTPTAQHEKIKSMSKKIFIFADEKEDIENTKYQFWKILYFDCLMDIVSKEFNYILQKYKNFCQTQNYDKELKLNIFSKFIINNDRITHLPNEDVFKNVNIFTI